MDVISHLCSSHLYFGGISAGEAMFCYILGILCAIMRAKRSLPVDKKGAEIYDTDTDAIFL